MAANMTIPDHIDRFQMMNSYTVEYATQNGVVLDSGPVIAKDATMAARAFSIVFPGFRVRTVTLVKTQQIVVTGYIPAQPWE